jgi:hypothetical protein
VGDQLQTLTVKLYFFTLLLLFHLPVYAQLSNLGTNEFSAGAGVLSYDQFAGLLGQQTMASGIISTPDKMTLASFLTYRHYFSKSVAIGVTMGVDNQSGELSYGKEGINGVFGQSGRYNREVYTGAAELLLDYHSEYHYKTYGYLGAGFTSTRITFSFFDNIPHQERFYGTSSSAFLHKNTTIDFSHYNFQVTPLGIRRGDAIAGFIEFGFGYKGMVHGGLSIKFNNGKHKPVKFKLGESEETLLLPYNYPVGSDLIYVAKVKAHQSDHFVSGSFTKELDDIMLSVNKKNGNVFKISDINTGLDGDNYTIKGRAYFSKNLDSFKASVMADKNKKFENGTCAYLIIYKTAHNFPGNNHLLTGITINNNVDLEVEQSSTCIYKIEKQAPYSILLKNSSELANIDIQFGKEYYIKLYDEFSRHNWHIKSHLLPVSNVQGNLESSLGKDIRHMKFEKP